MQKEPQNRWFWAWLVEMTLPKKDWNKPRALGEVWRNLIIIRATNVRQAVSKALKLGAQVEGDCDGTLRINGKPALTKFLGVEDIGLVHEDLDDGSEILWQLRKCRTETARRLVKRPTDLISSVENELESGGPISNVGAREVKTFIRAKLRRIKRSIQD
jgi:hypothetical protein